MFDISAGKLILIGVVALVVVGPKELPGLLRQAGRMLAKLRQMAGEFRAQFDEAMREAELDSVKKEFTEAANLGGDMASSAFTPLTDLHNDISGALNAPAVEPPPPLEIAPPPAETPAPEEPAPAKKRSRKATPKPDDSEKSSES